MWLPHDSFLLQPHQPHQPPLTGPQELKEEEIDCRLVNDESDKLESAG